MSVAKLTDRSSQALADLLPLLGCGEEAATMAFHRLAQNSAYQAATVRALEQVGDEERMHDALLTDLAGRLPPPQGAADTRRAARRFHLQLGRGGADVHLARIAAIDAAVCTILSRLIAPHATLAADPAIAGIFLRIRNDESRHVAVARAIVIERADIAALRDEAAKARTALADLLARGGAAFEQLAVDPDALFGAVKVLPNGLL